MQSPGPFDPLTPRQELISECEGLGLDADAPKDWRDAFSDDELRASIVRLSKQEA